MATLRQVFGNIADAIRDKGITGTMTPVQMADKISEIQTGGGDMCGLPVEAYGLSVDSQGNAHGPYERPGTWELDLSAMTKISKSAQFAYAWGAGDLATGYMSQATDNLPRIRNAYFDGLTRWAEPNVFYYAFNGNKSIEKVRFGSLSALYGIEDFKHAFSNCPNLKSVEMPMLTSSTAAPAATAAFEMMCYNCPSLTSVPSIPNLFGTYTPTYLFRQAFYGCTSLKDTEGAATLLNSYISCGNGSFYQTFYNCGLSGHLDLTLGLGYMSTSVTSQAYGQTFAKCTQLTSLHITAPRANFMEMFSGCTGLASVVLDVPELTQYTARMLSGCTSLTSLTLSSVTKITGCATDFITGANVQEIRFSPELSSIVGGTSQVATNYLSWGPLGGCVRYYFPGVVSITNRYLFGVAANAQRVQEIHFAAANQAKIEALTGYSLKFGATNATIYFDL